MKKNLTYVAGDSNFEYTFEISDRSIKICSSYVSDQLKKRDFEKNAFEVFFSQKS